MMRTSCLMFPVSDDPHPVACTFVPNMCQSKLGMRMNKFEGQFLVRPIQNFDLER